MHQFFTGTYKTLLCALIPLFSMASLQASDSYLVVEAHSGKVLLQKSQTLSRPVASLTKVATAVLVLDWSKITGVSLNTTVVVPPEAAQVGGANPMGLIPGDQITLRNALYSSLLGSDNIAALTLSTYVGADINIRRSGSKNALNTFVAEMNTLARTLGMNATRFVNPHGLDTGGYGGKSTAEDMAKLAIYAMRKPSFAFYVKQKSRKISFHSQGASKSFTVRNTNALLGQMNVNGLKTGTTVLAGQCFACCSEKPAIVQKLGDGRSTLTPRRLIVITLGSPDRFRQTQYLINQGWGLYDQWRNAGSIPIPGMPTQILNVPNPLQISTPQAIAP